MIDVASYGPVLPEILLAVGAMLLLMLGAFGGSGQGTGEFAGWLALVLLAACAYVVATASAPAGELFGGSFLADGYARFMKLLVLAGSAGALLISFDYLKRAGLMSFEVPVLVLLATVGMMMMISANDLIALYLGVELQSLALYVLAAINRNEVRSSEAGLKYFVLGALSSGMLLYGASLVYGFTGTTAFAGIARFAQSQPMADNLGLIVGLVFLLVGLAFKISAVPFHMWTPDVYEGAPTPITAFFAAAPKVAAMGLLIRVLFSAFPGNVADWQQIVYFLSIASMLLGAFAAIGQRNFKRLMAYSSIGHIGFALVGLCAANPEGVEGLLVYLAIYMVMTLGAFACILSMRRGEEMVEDIDELSGLAETDLTMAFILAMLLFSLAGIPPLAGFFAKFYVFAAAIKAGLYPLAVIGVLASVIGAYYYVRIVKIMFFDAPRPQFAAPAGSARVVMGLACLFVLAFAAVPAPLVDAATVAAQSLRP